MPRSTDNHATVNHATDGHTTVSRATDNHATVKRATIIHATVGGRILFGLRLTGLLKMSNAMPCFRYLEVGDFSV